MAGFRSIALVLASCALAAPAVSPLYGQCRLCATPTTALPEDSDGDGLQLDVQSSLDFGRLILAGSGGGAAVLRPDGSNAAEGALTDISARAMVGTAVVHGAAGRAIRVELPRRIDLYSISGGRITVDEVVSDLPSVPRLDSAGSLTFRFGGRVTVTGDSEGDYRGDMPITVEYQ